MRIFNCLYAKTAILVTALLPVVPGCSCGSRPPPQPEDQKPNKSAISWDDCLNDQVSNPPIRPMFGTDPGDPGGQGRELLGVGFKLHPDSPSDKQFVRVDRFSVAPTSVTDRSGAPISGVSVDDLELVGKRAKDGSPLSGRDWNGAIFNGKFHCVNPAHPKSNGHIRVRISNSEQLPANEVNGGPNTGGQTRWVHALELEFGDGTWRPACEDSNDVAFPLPGYWETNGKYMREPDVKTDEFSFACVKRDVAKCLRMGYSANAAARSDEKVLFEACTRMMRADYCGNGHSFTVDGSRVSMWDYRPADRQSIVPKGPDIDGLGFEAVWDAGGAVCVARPRYDNLIPHPLDKYSDCLASIETKECTPEKAKHDHKGNALLFNVSCLVQTDPCEKGSSL